MMSPKPPVILVLSSFVFVLFGCVWSAQSTEFDPLHGPNGLEAYVTKKGAKIRLYRNLTSTGRGKGKGKTGEITVFVDSIEEKDNATNKISGGGKHEIQSFANVDFTSNVSRDVQLPYGHPSAVVADCINCHATLSGAGAGGTMDLSVCAIKTNGTLVLDDENSTVVAGQLKFTFSLTSWPWDSKGAYLDVDIVIKVPPGRSVSKDAKTGSHKPVKLTLGAGAAADFSSKVLLDNAWKSMPADFPTLRQKGANQVITLRIPRFTTTVSYDPTVEAGSAEENVPSAASFPAASIRLAVVGMLIAGLKLL